MSSAIGNVGLIHRDQGRNVEAMECFGRLLAISEDLGDRSRMSSAFGNMGNIHADQGRYAEAMECYGRTLAICEELRDRHGMAIVIGNIGAVHADQGRYAEAMECYGRQLAICEEIGDRNGISMVIGNMGVIHFHQGRYAEAMQCYREALDGHRAIGILYCVTAWLKGTSSMLLELAEREQEICRDGIGMPEFLAEYVPGIIVGSASQPEQGGWKPVLQKAREDAEECVALSEQLHKPDTLFAGTVLLARIDAAEGGTDDALQRLDGMLADAAVDEHRAELHYWLWKVGRDEDGGRRDESEGREPLTDSALRPHPSSLDSHRIEALRLYQSLIAKTPKHDYRKRIDELSVPVQPPVTP